MTISEKKLDRICTHVEIMNKEFGMMVKRIDKIDGSLSAINYKIDVINRKTDSQNVELVVLKNDMKLIKTSLGAIGLAVLYQVVSMFFVAH